MLKTRQLTFWNMLTGGRHRPPVTPSRPDTPIPTVGPAKSVSIAQASPSASTGMQARYEHMTRDLLRIYGVRVRKWRTSMSGVAWEVMYRDGSVSRLIESPRPKGPMSAAVFCHEIGHHAIGFRTYRPRCLEEYHAWAWSLRTMAQYELNITQSVRDRMHDSLHYAIEKAARRGLKRIPPELVPFLKPRPKSR